MLVEEDVLEDVGVGEEVDIEELVQKMRKVITI